MKKVILATLLLSAPSFAATAFYKREVIDGMYKICYYDHLGSEVAITIRATKICPVTIQV